MAEHDTPTAGSGAHNDATGFAHVSVMRDEIVEVLSEVPDGIVVDATLGGAGHAAALLAANGGISILGLDRDEHGPGRRRRSTRCTRRSGHGPPHSLRRSRCSGAVARRRTIVGCTVRPRREFAAARPRRPRFQLPQRRAARHADGSQPRSHRRRSRQHHRRTDPRGDPPAQRRRAHARRIARAIIAARPISTTGELAEIVRMPFPPQPAATPDTRPARPFRRSASKSTTSSPCSKVRSPGSGSARPARPVRRVELHLARTALSSTSSATPPAKASRPRPDLPPPGHEASVSLLWRGARRPVTPRSSFPRAEAARFRGREAGAVA